MFEGLYYKLIKVDGKMGTEPCNSIIEAHDSMRALGMKDNHVAYDEFPDSNGRIVTVSTIFLAVNSTRLGYKSIPPKIFETMVSKPDDYWGNQVRYATWDEAVAGHAEMLKKIKLELNI